MAYLPDQPRPGRSRVASAVVAAGVAGAHLAVLYWAEGGMPIGVAVAVYLLPAAVTLAACQGAYRRWWRYLALFSLVVAAAPGLRPLVFFVAETWLLWRAWSVERDPGEPGPALRMFRGAAHRSVARSVPSPETRSVSRMSTTPP